MSEAFLLEERSELESRRGSRIYDVTAWSLPLAYGLEAYWAQSVGEAAEAEAEPTPAAAEDGPATYGYLIDGRDSGIYRALVRLLEADAKVRVATKPFTSGGRDYLPGTLLLRRHENDADLDATIATLSLEAHPASSALSEKGPDLGGQRFDLLVPPRTAICSQWPVATTSFGATWHLLDDRLGLRCSPINVQSLGGIDLRKYNVIVIPHVWSTGLLAGVLEEPVLGRLRDWVRAGGTLIAYGGAAAFLADEERGLSGVRRRRDVLDRLDVYREQVARETAARAVTIDPEAVWGGDRAEAPAPPEAAAGGAPEALERADAWARIFSPQGAIVAARLDPEHWLSFGLPERIGVLISGPTAYLSAYPVRTPARLEVEASLRRSGLLWPEARARLAETAYATVERLGAGQVILFATDPFFRGYFEGSGRLLQNAILLGPGTGTSPPVPW